MFSDSVTFHLQLNATGHWGSPGQRRGWSCGHSCCPQTKGGQEWWPSWVLSLVLCQDKKEQQNKRSRGLTVGQMVFCRCVWVCVCVCWCSGVNKGSGTPEGKYCRRVSEEGKNHNSFWRFFFWPHPWHTDIYLGQVSNPCHSSDPSHCSGNGRSLTHWAMKELSEVLLGVSLNILRRSNLLSCHQLTHSRGWDDA